LPEPDFEYRSKEDAVDSSANAKYAAIFHGINFDVCIE
jgi:hypothetical protein